jgi:hypothetical protein
MDQHASGEHEFPRIEILIAGLESRFVRALFEDFFSRQSSLLPTLYVDCRETTQLNNLIGKFLTGRPDTDCLIFEILKDADASDYPLAEISIRQYPSHTALFIHRKPGASLEDWGKVVDATRAILSKMRELNLKVQSVKPPALAPDASLPLWEQIPDHRSDGEMLRLWHAGYTNAGIGRLLSMQPRSVTSRISELRRPYGTEIVPLDTQRRRNPLNTDDIH